MKWKFWKKDKHICWKVKVESTGKTINQIISEDKELSSKLVLKKDDHCFFWNIYYKDLQINNYSLDKIFNYVCLECGQCFDDHKEHIKYLKRIVDEVQVDLDNKKLAEKIWNDKCEGK